MTNTNTPITSVDDVRNSVNLLHAAVLRMCNTTSQTEVNELFVQSKDLLINLFKYNTERTTND